ncbi:Endonuclease/exonuclease/phosphatase [Xylariaceae sp. FL0016]|nr:Endonuclease/exonuclease/phosphatase [Xylariaceae sp. FL0016]
MDELPLELNVITLNCWGLRHIAAHRAERLTAIGRYLATCEPLPHIVALQEVWTAEDYRSIRREARFVLPFGKFYHSGVFGSGLVILSKWPIEESTFWKFSLNGRPTAFWRGDWYVGKGVACARIRYGDGDKDIVEVFNTHTHPSYSGNPYDNSYTVHRLSQAWEIAKLVRGACERGHLVVALGDFNDVPLSLPYRLLSAHAPVADAWRVLYPESSLGSAEHELERTRRRPIPTAAANVADNGVTSQSTYNTWALRKEDRSNLVSPETPDPRGQRIDYIFFSRGGDQRANDLAEIPDAHSRENDGPAVSGWVVKDVRVGAMARHPQLDCSLSDHFSVEATLLLHMLIPAKYGDHPRRDHTQTRKPHRQQRYRKPHPRDSGIASSAALPTDDDDAQSQHSHTSADAGAFTLASVPPIGISQGAYLQSPAVSEYLDSRERAVFDDQLANFDNAVQDGLPPHTYDDILALVSAYQAREARQRYWRLLHGLFWALVALACWVAVWFVPRAGAFVFLVVSSLGLVGGSLDALMALLFFGAESKALKEFEWEIRNAKATASGSSGTVMGEEEKW